MIGDDVTNHPRSPWQARLARLRKAWMMEELQGIGGLDPPKIITTYLVAHPTNRKWVITPVIYMGFL